MSQEVYQKYLSVTIITYDVISTLVQIQLDDCTVGYLGEVTVVAGECKVHLIRLVVDKDPRVDRVLVEVAVCATSDCVEIHQVVKVGDFTTLPSLHHV